MSGGPKSGDALFASMDKVNSELFTLTYGAIVTQLVTDYKDVKLVNVELEKMGYNIGIRLIDEFLAKSGVTDCKSFKDTCNVIAKVALKMFLGINAQCGKWSDDEKACSIVFKVRELLSLFLLRPLLLVHMNCLSFFFIGLVLVFLFLIFAPICPTLH